MLKTALCISVLLVAANVCYGHGTCAKFHNQYFKITHFAIDKDTGENAGPAEGTYKGEYNHLHKTTYLNTGRLYSWGYSDLADDYDVSDWADYEDCPAVVPGTNGIPNPDPNKVDDEMLIDPGEASNPMPVNPCDPVVSAPATPYVPSTPDVPAETIPDEVISTPVVSIPDVMVHYSMTFPKGISALHLPIKPEVFYFTDLFETLGDDNVNWIFALRPTVQHWTHVMSVNSRQNEWISEYRGFVAYMENEATIELTAVERQYGYTFMYLRDGMNLIGVPRQAEALKTVGDFYQRFPGILSVKGIPADVEYDMPSEIDWDWFVDLDDDVPIQGTVGYMIESDGDDQYALWGTQWTEPVMAAPGITRNIAIMWGELKSK